MLVSSAVAAHSFPGMLKVSFWAEQQVGALSQVGCSLAVLEGACCFQPPGCKGGCSLRSSSQTETTTKNPL